MALNSTGAAAGGEAAAGRPRVFLSHSTKEELPQRVRDSLAEGLRTAGYRVLVDNDGLRAGEGWRNTLELWIGCCDAAVVLVSEQALSSPFVAHEVSVLAYRQRFQKNPPFFLVPVFVAPVTHSRVQESPLSASFLTEIEPVRIAETAGSTPADERVLALGAGVAAILERLEEAATSEGPLEMKLRELTALLETVPATLLEREAVNLDVHFEEVWLPYGPGEPLRWARTVACALVGAPLRQAQDTLLNLSPYLREVSGSPATAIAQALDLVASSWVSSQAADQILTGVKEGGRAFCADCSRPLTAEMYVARACDRPLVPNTRWKVGQVDGVVGEGAQRELEALVRRELERVLGVEGEEELQDELAFFRRQPARQVFVSLPGDHLDTETLNHLRDCFPGVLLFLLTGSNEPTAKVLEEARIERLRPPFGGRVEHADYPPLDEVQFESLYRDARRLLIGERERRS